MTQKSRLTDLQAGITLIHPELFSFFASLSRCHLEALQPRVSRRERACSGVPGQAHFVVSEAVRGDGGEQE